jgi:hypothetical protein
VKSSDPKLLECIGLAIELHLDAMPPNLRMTFQQMLDDIKAKKDRKKKDAYYFLFVRMVNRFLSKELVLVNSTIFAGSGILVLIYLYRIELN